MTETIYTHNALEDSDILGEHFAEIIKSGVETFSDKTAFSCILPSGHNASLSYTQVGELSDAVAAYLREELKLERGDVVAVQSVNALAYPVLICGIIKAGLTMTNVNPLYTPDETQHQLNDSGAKLLFVIDLFGDRIKESIEGTKVEALIRLSLVDLFPTMQRKFLGFMLQRVKKVVPKCNATFLSGFGDVIKLGKQHLAAGADVESYLKDTSPEDILFYQYTGGTTGRSKGAELTHRNVTVNVSQGYRRNRDVLSGGQHCMLLVLPLYHVFALAVGAMSAMTSGTHIVLVPVPRPVSNLKVAFETFDITVMPGVNTLYVALLQEDWFRANPPKSLQFCFSGAAPLNPSTAEEWETLTGAGIYEGYGLTESTCVVSSMPLTQPPKRGTCGLPVAGTELRIVGDGEKDMPAGEPGELWVRGPQIMKGYLHRPEATAETISEDGWLKTGDVAIIDEDGYLSIVDRMKDMVIVSGFNVYPTDIEDVLTRYDDVADAAVVGAPCDITGEQLVAYVVPGSDGLTKEAVIEHCRDHLTNYKVPKVVVFVKELPKSPVGKVLRRDLRDRAPADCA